MHGESITKETVDYVAHLARITLDDAELDRLTVELAGILGFIDQLTRVDTTGVPPTSHILPLHTVLRHDTLRESLSHHTALQNAPEPEGDFFGVPRVIE